MSSNRKRLSARLFLLKEMVVRDIRARYAGSGLGVFWAFGQPVLWLLLYAWVFGLILRIPVEKGFAGFPEFLLAGLLPWMAIQEGIWRASSALTDNAAMVKKTVFPLETLVLSVVLAAVVNQLIAFAIFAVYLAWLGHLSLAWTLLALPALLIQTTLTFGVACFAATVTTFLRDLAHGIGIALTVLFYATPIVYPASLVPARLRPWIDANPFSALVDLYRRAFTLHAAPPAGALAGLVVASGLAALAGGALFSRARPHFADLL
jgi:homopolymeric O-antigen transport system permease protein